MARFAKRKHSPKVDQNGVGDISPRSATSQTELCSTATLTSQVQHTEYVPSEDTTTTQTDFKSAFTYN